jgi:anti-sigma regulatory factor (Ser/Thr protein kinase)
VRSTLAGLGEYLKIDPELQDDLKTAISEACNNVVLHAYGGEIGPLRMSISMSPDDFEVTVRDQGVGIQRVSAADNRMGVGLAVISALARRAEFQSEPGEGTEVRMSFGSDGVGARSALVARGGIVELPRPIGLDGDIVATLGPAELLDHVLGRLVRAVAAGAHFSVDRFPSLHLLTSTLSSRAAEVDPAGEVTFSIVGRPKHLEVTVGPLPAGSSLDLFGGPTPPDLEGLIERIDATNLPQGEVVEIVVAEPRR